MSDDAWSIDERIAAMRRDPVLEHFTADELMGVAAELLSAMATWRESSGETGMPAWNGRAMQLSQLLSRAAVEYRDEWR